MLIFVCVCVWDLWVCVCPHECVYRSFCAIVCGTQSRTLSVSPHHPPWGRISSLFVTMDTRLSGFWTSQASRLSPSIALGSQTRALLGSWEFYLHVCMGNACLTVLVRASTAVIKHHNRKLGRKGLFHLKICSLASGVVGARAGAGAVEKFCLLTWTAWLLKSPRTTISGVAPPNVIKVLPHDHQPRRWSTDFPTGQSYRSIFSSKIPSSKTTLGSVKLTKRKQQSSQHTHWSVSLAEFGGYLCLSILKIINLF